MLMAVPMMQVGIMRVTVYERFVPVPMAMGLAGRILRPVRMLMVLVMRVTMLMRHRFVSMLMLVAFREMQPQTDSHQASCRNKAKRQRLFKEREREQCANKGREREISTCARRTEIPQPQHVKCKAHAITEETHYARRKDNAAAG